GFLNAPAGLSWLDQSTLRKSVVRGVSLDAARLGCKPDNSAGGGIMQRRGRNTFWIFTVSGWVLISLLVTGCSSTLPTSADMPVDCDVVKTQTKAGLSVTQIAANLNASVDNVASCNP